MRSLSILYRASFAGRDVSVAKLSRSEKSRFLRRRERVEGGLPARASGQGAPGSADVFGGALETEAVEPGLEILLAIEHAGAFAWTGLDVARTRALDAEALERAV